MAIKIIIIYIVFSIFLFFIQNYIDKKNKDSYIDNVIIANIYIIFLAGILEVYNITGNVDNIFLVVLFEMLLRIFYSNYVKEVNYFRDNRNNIYKYSLIIGTSILMNNLFISRTEIVFPKIENVKIIIWLLLILYLYNYFRDNVRNNTKKITTKSKDRDKEKIIMNYAKYSTRYYNVVETKYKELIPIIYTVMIYEDGKKSEFMRNIDKLKYRINHDKRKYGIMQIDSYYPIDDVKSIRLCIKHIEKIYVRIKARKEEFKPDIIFKKYYKSDDTHELMYIYDVIMSFKGQDL